MNFQKNFKLSGVNRADLLLSESKFRLLSQMKVSKQVNAMFLNTSKGKVSEKIFDQQRLSWAIHFLISFSIIQNYLSIIVSLSMRNESHEENCRKTNRIDFYEKHSRNVCAN